MALNQNRLEAASNKWAADDEVRPKRDVEIFDGTDYPREWSGFVGQDKAKEQLRVALLSAAHRGVRADHTLLASGIHGVGKTTLAKLAAYQSGHGLIETTGPLTAEDFRDLALTCVDHDIIFIDEAHMLVQGSRTKADWLLPFMTDGKLLTKRGAEVVPDVTVFAATTDAGRLPQTLLSRFMCVPEIVAYSPAESAAIAQNLADRMAVTLPDADHAEQIAGAADSNPRGMRRILTAVRDLQYAYPETHPNLEKAFDYAGVSSDGLTTLARDILMVLLTNPEYTASIEFINATLGEPGPLRHHEQQLLQRGLVTITGRGRVLTSSGLARGKVEFARQITNRS